MKQNTFIYLTPTTTMSFNDFKIFHDKKSFFIEAPIYELAPSSKTHKNTNEATHANMLMCTYSLDVEAYNSVEYLFKAIAKQIFFQRKFSGFKCSCLILSKNKTR